MIKLLMILLLFIVQSAGAQLATGSGTIGDPYQIWYLEDLAAIQDSATASYSLERSLDFNDPASYQSGVVNTDWTTSTGWTNITGFSGTVDGKNKSISNLYTSQASNRKNGLFREFTGLTASVTNLIFINPSIWANSVTEAGVLVADGSTSYIEGVKVIGGTILAANRVGGIVGAITRDCIIKDCEVSGLTITATGQEVGGVVGRMFAENNSIENCTVDVSIVGGNYAGGVAGFMDSTTIPADANQIIDTIASVTIADYGAITSERGRGGIVGGILDAAYIARCSANVNIITETNDYVGGCVGYAFFNADGLQLIEECFVTGYVESAGFANGFIGVYSGSGGDIEIKNCYSTVDVQSHSGFAAGFTPSLTSLITIENCYSIGNASASDTIGGFSHSGTATETITACYWDVEASGVATNSVVFPGSIESKTTAELYQQATFSGWDFDTVWGINEGTGYPYLLWSGPPPEPVLYYIKHGIGALKFSTNGALKFGGIE